MEVIPNDSPAPVDPMVYRDLLIFEESLRGQYLYLQRRRWKYLSIFIMKISNPNVAVFVCGLIIWLAYFTYGTIIAPSQVNQLRDSLYWLSFSIIIYIYSTVFLFSVVYSHLSYITSLHFFTGRWYILKNIFRIQINHSVNSTSNSSQTPSHTTFGTSQSSAGYSAPNPSLDKVVLR